MKELYENQYKTKNHFSFGNNWKIFLENINTESISEAKKSISNYFGDIQNKTFIDVGSGSGLFSLAAIQLGAKVTSLDIDDNAIECNKLLREKYKIGKEDWKILKGSVLSEEFIQSLGKFDLVYSWGVLHHTGNMYKALQNVDFLMEERSLLYLALYNYNTKKIEGTSPFWEKVKYKYNNSGKFGKKVIYYIYLSYLILGLCISGKNPYDYIKNYKKKRGMDFYIDIFDWLGGYPYEYATPEKITAFYETKNYSLKKIDKVRSLGCNQFLFEKNDN